jgi:CRISPR-associated protein Cas1
MAGAALWALGIPPHLSVFHGKTRAGGLVFDLADSFKDALVLPIAFSLAREKDHAEAERVFRGRLINAFDDREILKEAIATIDRMLASVAVVSKDA